MISKGMEPGDIKRRVKDLAEAMNDIRSSQTDKDDVVVELKYAKLSRLELLVEELKPVIKDIPKSCDRFEFAIARGDVPRLWVDMTTFVRLAGDGSDYELVKDTRMGRQVMAREASRTNIANRITSYVAEHLLERERMMEGDWITQSTKSDVVEKTSDETNNEVPATKVAPSKSRVGFVNEERHSSLLLLLWFVLGLVGGGIILFILFWFGMADKLVQMVI